MPDLRVPVQRRFEEDAHRFNVYGNILMRLSIQGFRCHDNTLIDIRSPITAFSGLNGTGKSTILQLAAVAYKGQNSNFHINDFIVASQLDPTPFSQDANFEYAVWETVKNTKPGEPSYRLKPHRLSRNAQLTRWNGYRTRPQREVFFAGVGQYLPKIEQHDFIIGKVRYLRIGDPLPLPDIVRVWTSQILSVNYSQIANIPVTFSAQGRDREGTVVSVERQGVTYSEVNMGYGEGRTQYLISVLENLPNQSLVLIEEPETSLHPSAQYQLGKYFIDVVHRKHHQIFLTTHSAFLLHALPTQSRIYLQRTMNGIVAISGLSAWQIRSLLSEGNSKALDVLVEDDVAEAVVRELVRVVDPVFLESLKIYRSGPCQDIALTLRTLNQFNVPEQARLPKDFKAPIVGVLDGDQNPDIENNIFSIPTSEEAPERSLFNCPYVQAYIQNAYNLDLLNFSASLADIDHHGWFDRLAIRVNQERLTLITECARAHASGHQVEAIALVEQLKGTSR